MTERPGHPLPGRFSSHMFNVMSDRCEAVYTGERRPNTPWLTPGQPYWVERVLDSSRQKRGRHQLWTVYREGFGCAEHAEVARGDLDFDAVEPPRKDRPAQVVVNGQTVRYWLGNSTQMGTIVAGIGSTEYLVAEWTGQVNDEVRETVIAWVERRNAAAP